MIVFIKMCNLNVNESKYTIAGQKRQSTMRSAGTLVKRSDV